MSSATRSIKKITKAEIKQVNEILKEEYYFTESTKIVDWEDLHYQCFEKDHACYSGYGIAKVYDYLKSVGIDIFIEIG